MSIASSDRTYALCENSGIALTCMNFLSCSIVRNELNITHLVTLINYYYYTGGRVSKHKYRFVGTDYQKFVFFILFIEVAVTIRLKIKTILIRHILLS